MAPSLVCSQARFFHVETLESGAYELLRHQATRPFLYITAQLLAVELARQSDYVARRFTIQRNEQIYNCANSKCRWQYGCRIRSNHVVWTSCQLWLGRLSRSGRIRKYSLGSESENILLGLAQADVAEQINVTAETPQLVDLTVLAESNGVSPNTLQWRARGAGDANNCAAFENRNDISLSLEKACDESIYQTDATVSTVATNTASSEPTSAPDACMVVIIERDSDNTESAFFEIHAPALTQPVALAYTIESVSGDGIVGLAHDVNLCIEP